MMDRWWQSPSLLGPMTVFVICRSGLEVLIADSFAEQTLSVLSAYSRGTAQSELLQKIMA